MNTVHTMLGRNRALAALLVAALLGAPLFVATSTRADEPKTISDHMGVINDHQKRLRRSARNKDFNDESIKMVGEMIEASRASREMVPPMAEKISDKAQKEKFIEGYKKEMDILIEELSGLKVALKEKRYDDAAKTIDKLNDIKKAGHDKYVEE
jgi:soluble cytochrome b562